MKGLVRISSIICCLGFVLSLCGCQGNCGTNRSIYEVDDPNRSAVESVSVPKIETPSVVRPDNTQVSGCFSSIDEINASSKNYSKIKISAGYDALQSDVQRDFYEAVEAEVYVVGSEKNDMGLYLIEKICLDAKMTETDIRVGLSAYKNDHPEIFWLSNQFSYIDAGTTEVQLYSNLSPDEISVKSEKLITAIEYFINKIPSGLSEFDRELKIHDLLLSGCVYNEEVESTSEDWRPFSIYGALVEGNAVCEGYSRAMQYLLSIFGIECNTINGTGNSNPHQWNIVKIDGQWYHLDATWDDTTADEIYYGYFNVSDSVISTDHSSAPLFYQMTDEEICGTRDGSTAELFNVFLPKCTSDEKNFYNVNAVVYDGTSEECSQRIEQKIIDCIGLGSDVVYLSVDEAIDYSDAINSLFYEPPYQFFTCIEAVNSQYPDTINDENVSILKREAQKIIEVHIQYKGEDEASEEI